MEDSRCPISGLRLYFYSKQKSSGDAEDLEGLQERWHSNLYKTRVHGDGYPHHDGVL